MMRKMGTEDGTNSRNRDGKQRTVAEELRAVRRRQWIGRMSKVNGLSLGDGGQK